MKKFGLMLIGNAFLWVGGGMAYFASRGLSPDKVPDAVLSSPLGIAGVICVGIGMFIFWLALKK